MVFSASIDDLITFSLCVFLVVLSIGFTAFSIWAIFFDSMMADERKAVKIKFQQLKRYFTNERLGFFVFNCDSWYDIHFNRIQIDGFRYKNINLKKYPFTQQMKFDLNGFKDWDRTKRLLDEHLGLDVVEWIKETSKYDLAFDAKKQTLHFRTAEDLLMFKMRTGLIYDE